MFFFCLLTLHHLPQSLCPPHTFNMLDVLSLLQSFSMGHRIISCNQGCDVASGECRYFGRARTLLAQACKHCSAPIRDDSRLGRSGFLLRLGLQGPAGHIVRMEPSLGQSSWQCSYCPSYQADSPMASSQLPHRIHITSSPVHSHRTSFSLIGTREHHHLKTSCCVFKLLHASCSPRRSLRIE
jgi:hypothetical protein